MKVERYFTSQNGIIEKMADPKFNNLHKEVREAVKSLLAYKHSLNENQLPIIIDEIAWLWSTGCISDIKEVPSDHTCCGWAICNTERDTTPQYNKNLYHCDDFVKAKKIIIGIDNSAMKCFTSKDGKMEHGIILDLRGPVDSVDLLTDYTDVEDSYEYINSMMDDEMLAIDFIDSISRHQLMPTRDYQESIQLMINVDKFYSKLMGFDFTGYVHAVGMTYLFAQSMVTGTEGIKLTVGGVLRMLGKMNCIDTVERRFITVSLCAVTTLVATQCSATMNYENTLFPIEKYPNCMSVLLKQMSGLNELYRLSEANSPIHRIIPVGQFPILVKMWEDVIFKGIGGFGPMNAYLTGIEDCIDCMDISPTDRIRTAAAISPHLSCPPSPRIRTINVPGSGADMIPTDIHNIIKKAWTLGLLSITFVNE